MTVKELVDILGEFEDDLPVHAYGGTIHRVLLIAERVSEFDIKGEEVPSEVGWFVDIEGGNHY